MRASVSVSSFALYVHDLRKKVMDKVDQSNASYKLQADIKKRFKFNVGDHVMVRIRPKRFSPRTVKRIHACSIAPFQI